MKKFEHVISINLVVKTNSEAEPSDEQIKKELNKFLKENPVLAVGVGLGKGTWISWEDSEEVA